MEIKKVYGSLDSAANSCVLLYDFFGNSYAGEPTTNLFSQPTGNTGFVIKPTDTGRHFYKLDYSGNTNGQGNFFDNAPGPFNKDVINIILFLGKQIQLQINTALI